MAKKQKKLDAANQNAEYILKLESELTAKNEALQKLQSWAKAYPLSVFPKPDLVKARKLLRAGGMTLDSIEADAMRHVITRVQEIIDAALRKEK